MRHNQNGRRYRGRSNGGGGQSHHHNNHSSHSNHSNNGQRRINPRVHTFDSNGPDVRIRGNAYQITEKYQGLAKDAASAGDRVLAESYLQHAEHYQRLINETAEEYNRHQPQFNNDQPQHNQGQQAQGQGEQPTIEGSREQPTVDAGMPDLDQGFLLGPRRRGGSAATQVAATPQGSDEQPPATVETRASRAAAAQATTAPQASDGQPPATVETRASRAAAKAAE